MSRSNRIANHRANSRQGDQQGMSLLIVMSLLVIMSITGVSAFNLAIMEQRMASNYTRLVSSEGVAMASILEASRDINTLLNNGDYDVDNGINLANIPSYTTNGITVTVRALTLQDLLDASIISAIPATGTLAGSAGDYVYFGYHNKANNTLAATATVRQDAAKVEYFTTTASRGPRLPVLVMTTTGTEDGIGPTTIAWVGLHPGIPILAGIYANGTVNMGGASGNRIDRVSTGEDRRCGDFLVAGLNGGTYSDGTAHKQIAVLSSECANCSGKYQTGANDYDPPQDLTGLQTWPLVAVSTLVRSISNMNVVSLFSDATVSYPVIVTQDITTDPGNYGGARYEIFYAPNDIALSANNMYGLLVVDGTLTINSGTDLRGMVVASGNIIHAGGRVRGAIAGGDYTWTGNGKIWNFSCSWQWGNGELPPYLLRIRRE